MDLNNDDKRYAELAEKWLNNTITPAEELEFSEWYNNDQDAEVIVPASFAENEQMLKSRMLDSVTGRMEKAKLRSIMWLRIRRIVAAASIIILISLVSFFYFRNSSSKQAQTDTPSQIAEHLPPGGNKAVLTLADGSKIILDNAENGTLSHQGSTKIIKLNAGQLSYKTAGSKTPGDIFYNTVSTPRGGQYQVILPDGTKVWLNAASSIKFPTSFTGHERNVVLDGEAYFEVAKNAAMPFTVHANNINVKVLGTHFNIMAYSDENAVNTTLLEGVVKIEKGTATSLLKPGQQARIEKDDAGITISAADIEEAIAWKNGLFQFNNEDISIIMRQIARWYDAEISFEGTIANKNFTGLISRTSSIQEVLKKLELTGELHCRIEGKKIVVTP